jgi:ligand-binding SRPBCC domain-containing protein
MASYQLTSTTDLPRDRQAVFAFFADARNLDALTPPWLNFQILTEGPIAMRKGVLIDYRIGIHGVPIRWRTEITTWEPPLCFVDEQLRGPYRRWVHTHTFIEVAGGTRVIDRVEYEVPGGALVHRFLVAPDLRRVFGFRARSLQQAFGIAEPTAGEVRIVPVRVVPGASAPIGT